MGQTGLLAWTAQGVAAPALPAAPLYSSAPLQWRGFVLERHLLPPGSIGPNVMAEHCLAVPRTLKPVPVSWQLNGQRIEGAMTADRAYFRAAGDQLFSAWHAPLDAIFLAVSPSAVALAHEELHHKSPALRSDLSGGLVDTGFVQLVLDLDAHVRGDMLLGGPLQEQSMLLACGLRLASLYSPAHNMSVPAPGKLSRRTLIQIDDFILGHLARPLSIDAIAAAVGLSPYHLSRAFRKTRDISLWQYVLVCRITYARRLVKHFPDLPLADVARASGFDSYPQFFQAFRKFSQLSPSQFRQSSPGALT